MARKLRSSPPLQPAETPGPPAFDAARLIADIRKSDPAAIERAFALAFDNDVGRLVLAIHLADCGVGNAFGPHLSDSDLRYAVGRHDAAVSLAQRARFDQAELIGAVFTDNLEERTTHETSTNPRGAGDFSSGYTPPLDDY